MELGQIVCDVATCMKRVDSRGPQASNARTGEPYQPGIGPHTERQVVDYIVAELAVVNPDSYARKLHTSVPYPLARRQQCDLCIGQPGSWEWAIEIKMLRLMGDNGKPNDNMLMHILSPYPIHRSALTDCRKLLDSGLAGRKAIVVYGFDYPSLPMDLAVDAFEVLAGRQVRLGPRLSSSYSELVHPVHCAGRVFGWELNESENQQGTPGGLR